MLNQDQINLLLSTDTEWQGIVDKTLSIDANVLQIQSRLTYIISQMTQSTGHRHIIQEFQIDEDSSSTGNGTPIGKNKSLFENIKVTNDDSPKQHVSPKISPTKIRQQSNLTKSAQLLSHNYQTISERFQICKFLGKGKFSDVYQAQEKSSKVIVALKVIPKSTIQKYNMEKQLAHEIKIQSFLDHPNILKLYGYFQELTKIVLILEYGTDGELFKQLKRQPKKRYSEQVSSAYIRQIIEGIEFMHSKNVIHRDIKPENILITHQLLKIADMGLSTYNPANQVRQSFCGTVDYMSPEIASGRNYDHTVDIWAIGILAYELCTGDTPFYEKKKEDTMNRIIYSNFDFPPYCSEEIKSFVRSVVQKEPKKRLTIQQMLQHSWIQKYEKEATLFNRDLLNQLVKILK